LSGPPSPTRSSFPLFFCLTLDWAPFVHANSVLGHPNPASTSWSCVRELAYSLPIFERFLSALGSFYHLPLPPRPTGPNFFGVQGATGFPPFVLCLVDESTDFPGPPVVRNYFFSHGGAILVSCFSPLPTHLFFAWPLCFAR